MTIGMKETLNKLSGIDKEKLAKKDEFTTQNFSTISNQFSNIFNNQFDAQFQNQFDYKKMFSNGSSKSDFMSNTASKMSDEKYYAQSYVIKTPEPTKSYEPSKVTFEQKTSPAEVKRPEQVQKTTENKQPTKETENTTQAKEQVQKDAEKIMQEQKKVQSESKNTTQAKEQVQKDAEKITQEQKQAQKDSENAQQEQTAVEDIKEVAVQTQVLTTLLSVQQVVNKDAIKVAESNEELETTPTVIKAESTDATAKLLVNIKATELENIANLTANETALTPKVDVQLKDVKIEKLDVKTHHQVIKQDKENLKPEVDTNKKPENASVGNIQNKVSLERLTANLVSENPEATTELDKLLNKDIIKKSDASAAKLISTANDKGDNSIHSDLRNSNAFMNNQGFNQNFGQANQEAQAQLKANILASNLTLDTSSLKTNTQSQVQMNNLVQPNQANTPLEKNVFDQVMKNIQGNISAQKSEVTMVLKPEHLGKVTLNIMNEKGAISAEFKAETQQAVDSLSKNIEELRETLRQQGVICSSLVVKLEEPNSSGNNTNFSQEQNLKDFSQNNAQNSDKDSSENKENNQTVQSEYKQDLQEEQEQSNQMAKDQGLVDYRV